MKVFYNCNRDLLTVARFQPGCYSCTREARLDWQITHSPAYSTGDKPGDSFSSTGYASQPKQVKCSRFGAWPVHGDKRHPRIGGFSERGAMGRKEHNYLLDVRSSSNTKRIPDDIVNQTSPRMVPKALELTSFGGPDAGADNRAEAQLAAAAQPGNRMIEQ